MVKGLVVLCVLFDRFGNESIVGEGYWGLGVEGGRGKGFFLNCYLGLSVNGLKKGGS